MSTYLPEALLIVAGRGSYPSLLAEGARQAGVKRLMVAGVRGMAGRDLLKRADQSAWFGLGELERFLDWACACGAHDVALAGQIAPTALFHTRFDPLARRLLRELGAKHAHSIYGRIADLLTERGLRVIPASCFMEAHLPEPGVLSSREPDAREAGDIRLGHELALHMSELDVGQTVVIKDGSVLAVEAWEGTNQAILRGAKLGGRGAVVVKVAKQGHDMRFDIPAIGARTIPVLRRARIAALAFQARRTLLLDREFVLAAAHRMGMALVALDSGLPAAPTRPATPISAVVPSANGGG
jgi:DUF1009 family protein